MLDGSIRSRQCRAHLPQTPTDPHPHTPRCWQDLLDNFIHDNAGFGANLQDCSGRYEGNLVAGNARGSVAVSMLFDLDPGLLPANNRLRGQLRRL